MSTKRAQNSVSNLEIFVKWLCLVTAVVIALWIVIGNPDWKIAFPAGFLAGVMVMYAFKDTE
jgi:Mn2+/Fe2+ NRAMP family transporter